MPNKVNKTNHIGIRATDAEKLDWELIAHAQGLKVSQLARTLLNDYSISHGSRTRSASLVRGAQSRSSKVGDLRSRREFNLQVARIGNNLNQIARWANTYKGAAEATQVIASLARIESALLELEGRGQKAGGRRRMQV